MLGRSIPCLLLVLPPLVVLACALERDGLGRTIEPASSSSEQDASEPPDPDTTDGSVLVVDALVPEEVSTIVIPRDAKADALYTRD